MSRSSARGFSANEKEIDLLLRENSQWSILLSYSSEELQFLKILMAANIYDVQQLNLFERLQSYTGKLDDIRSENMDLTLEVHKHRYDLEGMRECEDISCDIFYHQEHLKLGQQVERFLDEFRELKLEIMRYTGSLLKKSS